ncbi:MAG: phosphogluconate dehydrogenase (NAD(+)-dependent, decarboxylating) [Longimicrobiales bacterium]
MQLGMVGLGRMGGAMLERLTRQRHDVVGYDLSEENRIAAAAHGAAAVDSLEALVRALAPPRSVWIMVPHGSPTEQTIDALLDLLDGGDIIIDGGNSRYSDSMRAAGRAASREIAFVDAGVSGGVWGLEEGYCLMVGGPAAAVARVEPAFRSLAPAGGYAHVGPSGAGHFIKMIHNAIEYGFLEALGEGFECMEKSEFDIDLARVAALWQHGSVVRSWLLDLLGRAFQQNGNALDGIRGYVDDSGMGRWSVHYAVDHAVPTPVLTQALYARFQSRLEERFADRVIAALRNQFGGHAIHEAK